MGTKQNSTTALTPVNLDDATRSAFLSSQETGGKGVRPGPERIQTLAGGLIGGYGLETFSHTQVIAFSQRTDTSITARDLAKVLVVEGARSYRCRHSLQIPV